VNFDNHLYTNTVLQWDTVHNDPLNNNLSNSTKQLKHNYVQNNNVDFTKNKKCKNNEPKGKNKNNWKVEIITSQQFFLEIMTHTRWYLLICLPTQTTVFPH
jgi:hypothetical protein